MFCVTLKVLLFRYVYVMRQRWILTVFYLLFPLVACSLAVWSYDSIEIVKYESHIEEHDERSLLRIPEKEECTSSEQNDCLQEIVVCPGGAEERQLMDRVLRLLRISGNSSALDIKYVNNSDLMTDMLVKSESNGSWGLHFHEIASTTLEYTIRPRAQYIPSVRYDWGDYATTRKFPSPMLRGPRSTDPYFDVIKADVLTLTGFLSLQVAVDKAYIETHFSNVSKEWILTSFPYPPYFEIKEEFRDILSVRFYLIFVQYMLTMGITFMISVFASYTIHDKRSGILEWLCVNGAVRWMVNISWLVSFCFEATLVGICQMAILKIPTMNGPTIKYMSASVLTFVLVVCNWLSLCWVHLFTTFFKRQILCILIITAYWVFSPVLQWIPPDCFVKQGFLATLPNAGMVLIFKSFQEFDGAETVLGLDRLNTYPIHYLSVGVLLLIMLSTSVLLIALSMYLDLFMPGPYGRAKPWNIFRGKDKERASDENDDEASPEEGKYFEQISSNVGLECVGISKFFNKKKILWWHVFTAIKNVNMKIPKNKITVLLGPNGAGKSTLLSICCGMYSPSAGNLHTEEYDVFHRDNMRQFRKVLGYCPQSDLLLNELTIKQHLIIFGLLKGLSRKEAEENSKKCSKQFKMEKFENTKAKNLSGGTKRKLCLAIAMTGEPRYLLLDDPSTSLDVESLKTFWNVLLKEKGKCTVVLTTHNMDEAEMLGDRIALMVDGQLKAYGTSSFLKKLLETGFKLNITVVEKDRERVVRFVGNFDPSIKLLYETHNTLTFGFPTGKSKYMSNLLKSLESEFGDGITASLSNATMEDVLMTFSRHGHLKPPSHVDVLQLSKNDIGRSSNYCGQITAIFKKKLTWISNHSLATLIIILLIVPIIGTYATMYFMNEAVGSGSFSELHTTSLRLNMDEYNDTIAFVSRRKDDISIALRWAIQDSGLTVIEVSEDMVDFLNKMAKKDLLEYRSKMVLAFDSGRKVSDSSTAYYSRNALHSAPIAYSALMNAILGNASITTHNFPYVKQPKRPSCLVPSPRHVALLFRIILGPMLLIIGSYFVVLPHIERRTLFKHLQLMTGLLPWVYWISHLMFDVLMFLTSCSLIIVILAAKDIGIFMQATVMSALIIVLLLYGISIILFAYACSFCKWPLAIVVILFISVPPVLFIGNIVLNEVLLNHFSFLFDIENLYFLPWVILMEALLQISIWAGEIRACDECKVDEACVSSKNSLIRLLKVELLGLAIVSMVYFTFILAMDHGFGRKLKAMVDRVFYGEIEDNQGAINSDVANEKQRVKYLEIDEEEDQPELICDGLGKKYSSNVIALRDITFAHERGELLGLLGSDGAGKSTLLRILSGVTSPTKGIAIVRGKWDLSDCEYRYIRNIGYCPQFGGVLPGLSCRDTLSLFGSLRGLNSSKLLNAHVERWLEALNMSYLADRPCELCSAGNKRKLSFAIALIGFPSVVLLDEPTSGIDPVVRRRIWEILYLSWRNKSQAVVLTSRTFSECEAICDRLAILVNGEMKCLASVPKLKNTFGKTCTLDVKLQENTTPKQLNIILQKILKESQFARYAKLQEKQLNSLKINVKTDDIKTYDVFTDMSKIKDENSAIDDFSLTDTPLEEVVMRFAQQNASTTGNLEMNESDASPQPQKMQKTQPKKMQKPQPEKSQKTQPQKTQKTEPQKSQKTQPQKTQKTQPQRGQKTQPQNTKKTG